MILVKVNIIDKGGLCMKKIDWSLNVLWNLTWKHTFPVLPHAYMERLLDQEADQTMSVCEICGVNATESAEPLEDVGWELDFSGRN